MPKAAQVVPSPTCTSRGRAGRVVLSTSATFPASCLWHQPVSGMLLVGLGKPCLCLENTIAGTVLQRGQPRPCSQGRDTLFGALRNMAGTWSPWGHGELATTAHVGPCSPALPSAPVFVGNMDTSLQEAGRRVIWSTGCLLSFPGSGQDTLFISFFSFFESCCAS